MNEHLNFFHQKAREHNDIANDLFRKYDVKKGLRDEGGTRVRVGLTKIADVVGYEYVEEVKTDGIGKLYYRDIELRDITHDKNYEAICGYEKACFLLFFDYPPKEEELQEFCDYLYVHYGLPDNFLESRFLHMPGKNLVNRPQQAVPVLYDYDDALDDIPMGNTLEQGLDILAKLPSITCYAYQGKMHRYNKESLVIHPAQEQPSIAENILYMLCRDHAFGDLETKPLNMMLIVHAGHGGGNNLTSISIIIPSTRTDSYSSVAGAIGSMRGPRHGGTSLKASGTMKAVIEEIGYCEDDIEVKALIYRILHKQLYDYSGLVRGMRHAVYTLSNPRSEVLQEYIERLAEKKDKVRKHEFYQHFGQCTKEVTLDVKRVHIFSNMDFYSGFIYGMMDISEDLFTSLFIMTRTIGWLVHNIENKGYNGRTMHPVTKCVGSVKKYVKTEDR